MANEMKMERDKKMYPDVVVKISRELYSINSRYITAITNMQGYNRMPGAPKEVLGVMDFRGRAVPLIDMRILFGFRTRHEEFDDFKKMIDERKQDHVNWVNKLEECTESGEKFPLATDPHKCAFGKWFYSFRSDQAVINHHMHQIEEPHRRLHEMALEIEKCGNGESGKECKCKLLAETKTNYMAHVMGLLDEAKEVFQGLYTEMLIVLELGERQIAIVIDEVLAVEMLETLDRSLSSIACPHSKYICEVKQMKDGSELILELSDSRILGIADQVKTENKAK